MLRRTSLVLGLVLAAPAAQADGLDGLFAQFGQTTPGCAVGIDRSGQRETFRAYGMSDLEQNVPNKADTIFEAGSISKQFTAAAILTLVHEGKLALTHDIRKYLPEMADFGTPITVDELLNHTSGLRDWGEEEDLAGWPRTDRVYDLDMVLSDASRQRALNYAPGTHWSYTNTGFNLLAIIVQRVSGKSLAQFTRERFFVPLAMKHTSWRDDFRRIVPGRAIAYERKGKGYEQLMPFENAYGNGGLLTTAGDLLIWNRALTEGKLGKFVTEKIQEPSKLASGQPLNYARGLFLDRHHGVKEVSHSGSTAGYTAWLSRFPDNGLSVAILCNGSDALPQRRVLAVEDLYLPREAEDPKAATLPPLSEWYADARDGRPLHVVAKDGNVSADGRPVEAVAGGGVRIGGTAFKRLADGRLQGSSEGDDYALVPQKPWSPDAKDLAAMVGRYASQEAHAVLVVSLKDGALEITPDDRPSFARKLTPAYDSAFAGRNFTVRAKRDGNGHVTALILSNARVWALAFEKLR